MTPDRAIAEALRLAAEDRGEFPAAFLVEWPDPDGGPETWVQADANEHQATTLALRKGGTVTPLYRRAPAVGAEAEGWRPMATAPKSGEYLLGVWEGEWRNPKQRFAVYQATGYYDGPSWSKRGHYRTEEGGAYSLAGWMPLPKPPAADRARGAREGE